MSVAVSGANRKRINAENMSLEHRENVDVVKCDILESNKLFWDVLTELKGVQVAKGGKENIYTYIRY
jgi:hypothetical protein